MKTVPDPLESLVRSLRTDPRLGPNIVAVERLPPAAAQYEPWPDGLDDRLRTAAEKAGVRRLYRHQAQAIQRALSGMDVAVVSGTASGKSLCYLLPVLDALLRAPEATALLLFPTKALANDQLAALRDWSTLLGADQVRAATYDGDTPPSRRAGVRATANVLISNPDMLHAGVLPHHVRWDTFLAGLRYVVVDEMHVYRGVFGSHVANVLRRLRRVARFHGSRPRFVLTSATVANPGQLAGQLSGGEVAVVEESGAPRGARTFVFYNPPIVDEALQLRRSQVLEAEALARHFLAGGVQTIVFARSRQSAELLVRYLQTSGDDGPIVRGYRGGYLAGERRATEAALRSGELRGVVATNALELGIDVGELDACVMAGYPGTIASAWQQAGRAGRRAGSAVAVLVAGATPLDQFVIRHPEHIVGKSPEHARLDPDNLLILLDHVRCAAFELPFHAAEAALPFGAEPRFAVDPPPGTATGTALSPERPSGPPAVGQLLSVLAAQRWVREVEGSWYWLADAYPAEGVGLRTSGPAEVAIVMQGGDAAVPREAGSERPRGEGEVLGTVSRDLAPTTVHPGAVYLHDGAAYAVTQLDWEGGRALVVPADGALYTRASARVDVRPLRVLAERPATGAHLGHGQLEVRSKATGFRRIRFRTHETVSWEALDLPEQTLETGGYWFVLDESAVALLRSIGRWEYDPSGSRGPDWPQQRAQALARDGHRCQVCGVSAAPGRSLHVHHRQPYRTFRAGGEEAANRRAANSLENLVTLCPSCHSVAERALGLHGGMQGLGYAMVNIAPLFLMCDPRDLGVTTSIHAPWSRGPTVVLYERVAAGVGFGETLFHLHDRLLAALADLVGDCRCRQGCPACVGPAADGADAKGHVLAVLAALGAEYCPTERREGLP